MRGRTNVSGGGELFVDGNVIDGIVDETSGIVSGDFVEKIVTAITLKCGVRPKDNISEVFSIGTGLYCIFFNTDYGVNVWKFKIENGEFIDQGVYSVGITSGYQFRIHVIQLSGSVFIESHYESLVARKYGRITIQNDSVSYTELSTSEETENSKHGEIEKITQEKFVSYKSYQKTVGTQTKTYTQFSIVSLSGNTLTFGPSIETDYSLTSNFLLYDETYFIFTYSMRATLFKISGNSLSIVKEVDDSVFTSQENMTYIGENKILAILSDVQNNIYYLKGVIITLSENTFMKTSGINLCDLKSSLSYELMQVTKVGNKIFAIIATKHGPSYSATYEDFFAEWNVSGLTKVTPLVINKTTDENSIRTYYGICASANSLSFEYVLKNDLYADGFKLLDNGISGFEETVKFKKYTSRIDGVAKLSGSKGQIIEVYVPKT